MEVILLERIAKLGQMGDASRVRDGFARNFLLPQGKALRANEANKQALRGRARAARGAQSRAQARSPGGRRQARRQDVHGRPLGRRDRPALRLGRPRATSPMLADGRLQRRPQPGRAQPADQGDRPARGRGSCSTRRSRSTITLNVARSSRRGRAAGARRGPDFCARRSTASTRPRKRQTPKSSSRRARRRFPRKAKRRTKSPIASLSRMPIGPDETPASTRRFICRQAP